jgi:hypothetical protein
MPEASSVVDKLRPLHPPVPDGTADILIMTLVGCVAGEAWLTHLDSVFETRLFSEGLGRAYGDALYQPRQDDPTEALDAALGRLLARLEK